jgi:hypothetical protein
MNWVFRLLSVLLVSFYYLISRDFDASNASEVSEDKLSFIEDIERQAKRLNESTHQQQHHYE